MKFSWKLQQFLHWRKINQFNHIIKFSHSSIHNTPYPHSNVDLLEFKTNGQNTSSFLDLLQHLAYIHEYMGIVRMVLG